MASSLGKEIVVPDGMIEFINLHVKENNYVVISYNDSTDCNSCSFLPLTYWKYYQREVNKYKIKNILIAQSAEHDLIKYFDDFGISYPVIFDAKGEFKLKNKLSDNPKYHTIIINKDKKVIWIGSPVLDHRTWDLFIQMLKSLEKGKK